MKPVYLPKWSEIRCRGRERSKAEEKDVDSGRCAQRVGTYSEYLCRDHGVNVAEVLS